jgi:hypothetical protein
MSFSYSAANVENDYNINQDSSMSNLVSKRKNAHGLRNKTQRRPIAPDVSKIKSVIQSSSSSSNEGFAPFSAAYADDEDDNNLGDFNPLPPPMSHPQQKEKTIADNYSPLSAIDPNTTMNVDTSAYNMEDSGDKHNLDSNFMTEQQQKQYYRKLMGNYPNTTPISSSNASFISNSDSDSPVLTKLNYLIHLMEEQQSEKTDSVVEDIVLYSFLGVFMIFMVDSFVRVGKYVR